MVAANGTAGAGVSFDAAKATGAGETFVMTGAIVWSMTTGAALTGAFVMTGAIVWSMTTGAALTGIFGLTGEIVWFVGTGAALTGVFVLTDPFVWSMGTGAALTGAFVMTGAIVWSMETGAALTRGFVATVITGTIETGTGVGGAGTLVGAVEFASLQKADNSQMVDSNHC
jgi:hypothetical protein